MLRFVANLLTGSNSAAVYLTWYSVGKVLGATAGVDIDAFGFGSNRLFSYVRLTDDVAELNVPGETAAADIDAVGAISTVVATPEPGTMSLLLSAGAITLIARKIRPAYRQMVHH